MAQRCAIERRAVGSDGGGGQTETWAAHLTNLPCRTWFETGREKVIGDRITVTAQQCVIVPIGTDVTAADRLASIADRLGQVVLAGPEDIATVAHRTDHVELRLAVRTE